MKGNLLSWARGGVVKATPGGNPSCRLVTAYELEVPCLELEYRDEKCNIYNFLIRGKERALSAPTPIIMS